MAELPHRVGILLRDPVAADSVRRVRRRVGERRVRAWRGERRLRTIAACSVGALAVAASIALVVAPSERSDEVRRADGRPLERVAATDARLTLTLEDGVSLALEPDGMLGPGTTDETYREVELLRGRLITDVMPGSPRRFRVDAGIVLVEVLGTRFTVDRRESSVQVAVSRGRVRVHDRLRDAWTTLGPGAELTVGVARIDRPAPGARERRELLDDAAETPPEPEPVRPQAASWRELAGRGDYEGAWNAIGPGRFRQRVVRASPEELLALADVARRSGTPEHAVAPLERMLSRHVSDPRAPLAAYTLGLVQMDQLRDPAAAAAAFSRARALGLRGTLAEHALGRLALCQHRAGDHTGAMETASAYLRSYPDGAMARQVERLGPD